MTSPKKIKKTSATSVHIFFSLIVNCSIECVKNTGGFAEFCFEGQFNLLSSYLLLASLAGDEIHWA